MIWNSQDTRLKTLDSRLKTVGSGIGINTARNLEFSRRWEQTRTCSDFWYVVTTFNRVSFSKSSSVTITRFPKRAGPLSKNVSTPDQAEFHSFCNVAQFSWQPGTSLGRSRIEPRSLREPWRSCNICHTCLRGLWTFTCARAQMGSHRCHAAL